MWQVKIHRLVLSEDFRNIDPHDQKTILKAFKKKLSVDPQNYGEPLRGGFAGFWRLRVGDFRAIYQIDKGQVTVLVIKVGIRRDNAVYEELFKRIRKL